MVRYFVLFLMFAPWTWAQIPVDSQLIAQWSAPATVRENSPVALRVELRKGSHFSAWMGWRSTPFRNWSVYSQRQLAWTDHGAVAQWALIPPDTGLQILQTPIGDFEYEIPPPDGAWGALPSYEPWVIRPQNLSIMVQAFPRPLPEQFYGDFEPCELQYEIKKSPSGQLLHLVKKTAWPGQNQSNLLVQGVSLQSRRAQILPSPTGQIWRIEEWHWIPNGAQTAVPRWLCWDEKALSYRIHPIQIVQTVQTPTAPPTKRADSAVTTVAHRTSAWISIGTAVLLLPLLAWWIGFVRRKIWARKRRHSDRRWQKK